MIIMIWVLKIGPVKGAERGARKAVVRSIVRKVTERDPLSSVSGTNDWQVLYDKRSNK